MGVGSIALNRPPADVNVVGPKASLIVRRDLHPAIQYLLLEAASEIHSAPDLFQRSGQFPAPEHIDLPLSAQASQFYRSGPPFLQRYLPFWLAVLASGLLVLLIPIVGIAYPLLRGAPALWLEDAPPDFPAVWGPKFIEAELETATGTAPTAQGTPGSAGRAPSPCVQCVRAFPLSSCNHISWCVPGWCGRVPQLRERWPTRHERPGAPRLHCQYGFFIALQHGR